DLLTRSTSGPPADASRRESHVLGAITHHARYGLQIIWARSTILACGGAGQVFRETTNPKVATGDGLAMAFRAGAAVADVEFVQFHPTTLYIAGATRSLITEAVRGEGGFLVDRRGERFMVAAHPMAELAPRDIVSRTIVEQLARSQDPCVFLDIRARGSAWFVDRFPGLARLLAQFDLDPGVDLIPVRPCAHYTVGGVWCDLDGRTTVPGLFVCGEVACSGLHGANRLASNSLLEGLVFGRRAGVAASIAPADGPRGPSQIISSIPLSEGGEIDLGDVRSSLRSAMWRNVGIVRTGSKLHDAVEMFDFWGRYTMDKIFDEPDGWEVQNMITVAALLGRAAAWRTETRGAHARTDFPASDDGLLAHALWSVGCPEPRLVRVGARAEAMVG
ncbi:MAG: FAD-binding protein, partial [Phycisphaerales bacterium]|nr:FAD-binding protein [Phycisphaerales bacterium]